VPDRSLNALDSFSCQRESFRQEAQLSQIDRAMLRANEYFAKSLKVTETDII